jgi:demethylmenaquinone methyltransferase/2-methoxy-6-polyprenyl-1,4-benzoquinol methylase
MNNESSKKDQTIIIETFSELAPRYEKVLDNELQRFWGLSYSRFIETLVNHIPISNGDLILDVATGTSVIPLRLLQKGHRDIRVVGLDITFGMLKQGSEKIQKEGLRDKIPLTCGDATVMPFSAGTYQVVICGLATHHMDVARLLSEIFRVITPGGILTVADAGGSPIWKSKFIRFLIKIAAFVYFFFTENRSRALAESSAVPNIMSAEDWYEILSKTGFIQVEIEKLPSSHSWMPHPLLIKAQKPSRP